jgi:hypothetical protein
MAHNYIAKRSVKMAILGTFQRVKKPDYPVHPVANTNAVKFTKEYMSLYQRRYYQQNKERIKANYLKNRQHFLKYKRQYYQENKETIFLKISIREKVKKYGLCPVLVLASLRSSYQSTT